MQGYEGRDSDIFFLSGMSDAPSTSYENGLRHISIARRRDGHVSSGATSSSNRHRTGHRKRASLSRLNNSVDDRFSCRVSFRTKNTRNKVTTWRVHPPTPNENPTLSAAVPAAAFHPSQEFSLVHEETSGDGPSDLADKTNSSSSRSMSGSTPTSRGVHPRRCEPRPNSKQHMRVPIASVPAKPVPLSHGRIDARASRSLSMAEYVTIEESSSRNFFYQILEPRPLRRDSCSLRRFQGATARKTSGSPSHQHLTWFGCSTLLLNDFHQQANTRSQAR